MNPCGDRHPSFPSVLSLFSHGQRGDRSLSSSEPTDASAPRPFKKKSGHSQVATLKLLSLAVAPSSVALRAPANSTYGSPTARLLAPALNVSSLKLRHIPSLLRRRLAAVPRPDATDGNNGKQHTDVEGNIKRSSVIGKPTSCPPHSGWGYQRPPVRQAGQEGFTRSLPLARIKSKAVLARQVGKAARTGNPPLPPAARRLFRSKPGTDSFRPPHN